MSQQFVLAFGGTGARCAEALTYLLASRSIRTPTHVLIVDPDETNGNVSIALAQLHRYHAIHKMLTPADGEGAFFSTPVNAELPAESFSWSNPQKHEEFGTLLQYAAQGPNEKALLDLLYDEDDMRLSFEKGYIGRAHIGSLDLLRTLEHQVTRAVEAGDDVHGRTDAMLLFFRRLRNAAQQPGGAKVLVVGSVFGGTGASGLPAIPPLLRKLLPSGLRAEMKVACVQVAPYFSFPPGREEDPDSALHPLATQAALYHYSLTNVGYERIYLVGAPNREQANDENVPGGDAQRNAAHYVELASALAAAHFFANPPKSSNPEVLACGADEVHWTKLPYGKDTQVRRNLTSLTTFCLMYARYLAEDLTERRHMDTKWLGDLQRERGRTLGGQEAELRALRDFAERLLTWTVELKQSGGENLFATSARHSEDSLAQVVPGGGSDHAYHKIYRNLNTAPSSRQETGQGWFIEALTSASVRFCRDNYQSWWS